MKKLVIAIDGPAASGKSTTAKLTANRLHYLFVDTGAMYRAMTLKVLEHGVDPANEEAVGLLADQSEIQLRQVDGELKIFVDRNDVTRLIRSQAVTRSVSAVSAIRKVRDVMVREQRRMGQKGGVVLEGRDIGTVVFPGADLKIFMIASVDERVKRRQSDLLKDGVSISADELKFEILERDTKDSKRNVSPLRKASDAIVLDTSDLTVQEQVDFIVGKAEEILQRQS